jgi:hypothetical protein
MTHRRRRAPVLAAGVGLVAALLVLPAAAGAAVTLSISGDAGTPVPLTNGLNIRNMSPQISVHADAGENWRVAVTGPNGAAVSATSCSSLVDGTRYVDYVGNGVYTVSFTTYTNLACTAGASTQTIPFNITASTALGVPQNTVVTRKAGSVIPNTVAVPIDLNPGALATEAYVARNVAPNLDGSLPGTPAQLFPDSATKTVPVRLDQGPGNYVVAARAKGFTGVINPQAFSPWAAPITIHTVDPFDLDRFRWTDQRGPSYRFSATVRSAAVTGRVSLAIGRGTKGKYRSYGTVKVSSKHTFAKRFRLSGTGKYRIRFKYKGNANVAGGFEVRKFQIRRTIRFASASIAG